MPLPSELSIKELALNKTKHEYYSSFNMNVLEFNLVYSKDKIYELGIASTLG